MVGETHTNTNTIHTRIQICTDDNHSNRRFLCVCTCGKEDLKERTGERERAREVGDVRKKGKSLVFVGGEREEEKRRERDACWETRDRCVCVRARARDCFVGSFVWYFVRLRLSTAY